MAPVLGKYADNKNTSKIIDAMTLFCIGAGMAGSLGQGIMNMSGGIAELTGMPKQCIHVDDCGHCYRDHLYCYGSFRTSEGH